MPLPEGRWALLTAFFVSSVGLAQDPCAACHGADGNSQMPGIPSIAGQPKIFLENQLIFFREELRKSAAMLPVVKGMKDPEIIKLAERFARLPARSVASGPADKTLLRRGEGLARKLRCGQCHTPDFRGQNQIPRLAGQREEYLDAEMRAYRDNKRTGDTIMAATLYGVKDEEIRALAHFLAHRAPRK